MYNNSAVYCKQTRDVWHYMLAVTSQKEVLRKYSLMAALSFHSSSLIDCIIANSTGVHYAWYFVDINALMMYIACNMRQRRQRMSERERKGILGVKKDGGRVYPISCVYSGRLTAAVGSFTHILAFPFSLCSPDIASYVEKPTTSFSPEASV